VPEEPSRIRQQRCEPLYPAVDRDVIDLHTALSQQLLDVPVDGPYRKYERTATTITSAGNRKPANAERDAGRGRRRVESLTVTSGQIHNRLMQTEPLQLGYRTTVGLTFTGAGLTDATRLVLLVRAADLAAASGLRAAPVVTGRSLPRRVQRFMSAA